MWTNSCHQRRGRSVWREGKQGDVPVPTRRLMLLKLRLAQAPYSMLERLSADCNPPILPSSSVHGSLAMRTFLDSFAADLDASLVMALALWGILEK